MTRHVKGSRARDAAPSRKLPSDDCGGPSTTAESRQAQAVSFNSRELDLIATALRCPSEQLPSDVRRRMHKLWTKIIVPVSERREARHMAPVTLEEADDWHRFLTARDAS